MRSGYSHNTLLLSQSYSNAFAADAGNGGLVDARRILNPEAGEAHLRAIFADRRIRSSTCAIRGLDKVIRQL
jgi:hypothetical protein